MAKSDSNKTHTTPKTIEDCHAYFGITDHGIADHGIEESVDQETSGNGNFGVNKANCDRV